MCGQHPRLARSLVDGMAQACPPTVMVAMHHDPTLGKSSRQPTTLTHPAGPSSCALRTLRVARKRGFELGDNGFSTHLCIAHMCMPGVALRSCSLCQVARLHLWVHVLVATGRHHLRVGVIAASMPAASDVTTGLAQRCRGHCPHAKAGVPHSTETLAYFSPRARWAAATASFSHFCNTECPIRW